MTEVERLAAFVVQATFDDLSSEARRELKIRVLDSLGCAIGALGAPPIAMLRAQIGEFGGHPLATMIGGAKTAPDRAAFYNAALVRYLDYNDSFLAPGETCHPSDSLGAVLAVCEYVGGSGADLLTALAVAYQVQCRLSEAAPVRARGFDHTTQGAYAVAAGVAKGLDLDQTRAANAIAIAGTAYNALRVTRTGRLSHWKGLASPNSVYGATQAAFLARQGITGPLEVFEGNKGFKEAIAGPFTIEWEREDLEIVRRTILKRYNAEIHSQSALEAILELRQAHHIQAGEIQRIELETFDVAYNIIGGGEEGDKDLVHTKEEADHSLPYLLAVALLDGNVGPAQFRPERIVREDVQALLRRVTVRPDPDSSRRFPQEMPCRLAIQLTDGQVWRREQMDYEGFVTRPMRWEIAAAKFERLAAPYADRGTRQALIEAVAALDTIAVRDLTAILGSLEEQALEAAGEPFNATYAHEKRGQEDQERKDGGE
jgi:2-methylcitrate dehydratase